jgi:long-chain acyl-CoA synthetase
MTATLRFRDEEIPPAAFDEAARRAAGALERAGLAQGDVACLMLRNRPEYLVAMLAVRMLGAYYCPINWHYKADEAGWVLQDSGARALVVDPALRPQIEAGIPAGLPVLGPDMQSQEPWNGAARVPGALMAYTSGTTGRAKGVRRTGLTPAAVEAMTAAAMKVLGLGAGSRALLSAPLYHSAPAGYGVLAMLRGELLVLEERFDAERTLALIERHRLTHAYLVPTMFIRLLRLPAETRRRYDTSSLRFVACTGSPCPAEVKRAMIEWLGPVIHEAYAASELGYVTLITPEESLRKPGSAGRASGGAIVRILDKEGRELPPGEVGLIYARQPSFPDFTYNNNPEARRKLEREGLWTMGDMGFLDAEGYLYICDRAADMVISGGVNIYPAEIEAALALMPGVRDCAVFGVPDEEFGEALLAAVQPEAGASLSQEAVVSYLKSKIADYKVPRQVTFQDELPREESGKIFKRRLRAPYWEKAGRKI